jgi:hypothetical protein
MAVHEAVIVNASRTLYYSYSSFFLYWKTYHRTILDILIILIILIL